MERTERLLDLVALLLDTREPISWAELRDAFPEDYRGTSDEADERKFERDKAELLELGIPIAYVQGDDERKDGYVIERGAYYLPDAGLTPEELALLYTAGSAALASNAFPGRQDLAHALRKIGFLAGTELPTPHLRMETASVQAGMEIAPLLEQLWATCSSRKWIEISYYSPRTGKVTSRRVDPYGLALRRGVWSLVGYCHLRSGIRTFQVHRIRKLGLNSAKPRSPDFEVPRDFKLDDYVAGYPWQHRFHEPVTVTLALSGEPAKLASRIFAGATVVDEEGLSRVTVHATYLDGLLRYVLSLSAHCRVLAPERAVERWKEMATAVIQRHQVSHSVPGSVPGAQT